jgi:hypothetical protein
MSKETRKLGLYHRGNYRNYSDTSFPCQLVWQETQFDELVITAATSPLLATELVLAAFSSEHKFHCEERLKRF